MEIAKCRGKHRIKAEEEIIRRREREMRYNELWKGTAKYYDRWNKATTKFEEWTSPRYYDENNKLLSKIKNKRDKEEFLEKRREKLCKLLDEENQSMEIELMVHKNQNLIEKPKQITPDVSTNILKEVTHQLKLEQDLKRRREAESKLFDQWRRNNPLIRQCEAKYKCRDLKLSWLDQQIEKQMLKEKEEEEARKILKENEKRMELEREKRELHRKQLEDKKQQLKKSLDDQISDIKNKQTMLDELKEKEHLEIQHKIQLAELEEKLKQEEQRRKNRECALFNIRQHNRKLKQKCLDIQETLKEEKLFLLKVKELHLEDMIKEEAKRNEIKQALEEFLDIVKQQEALEIQRQKRLEFLFESEAKAVYEMQVGLWKQEELSRKKLMDEVFEVLKQQINEKLEANKEMQKKNLKEREEMSQKLEEYHEELNRLKQEEMKYKDDIRNVREEDLRLKQVKKKQEESFKIRELDEELERIRKEEERLKQEILNLQQKQVPYKQQRSRFLV